MKRVSLFFALSLAISPVCFGFGGAAPGESDGIGTVPSGATGPVIGAFRNTYYYLLPEKDFAGLKKDNVIRDLDGNVLAQVSTKYKNALDIEGSGKLQDGRVVNYIGRVGKEVRYRIVPDPYGRGVGTCPLSPFRSIAVDPSRIALGSIVKIDEFVGMKLPDGSVHDGIVKAIDIGGAIKNDRIDIFVGAGESNGVVLENHGITHLEALTIRLVQGPPSHSCVDEDPHSK